MRSLTLVALIVLTIFGIYFFSIVSDYWMEGREGSTTHTTTDADTDETHTGERIINADSEPGNWLSHGRNYQETRFSPLDQINDGNVAQLGLAWSFDYQSSRGLEATPIVADGVIYTTADWSRVFAHNAKTGELLWQYDPQVPREWGAYACCDVVNRGVALWQGKVFVGTLNGYLVALDAATGEEVWRTNTIDRNKPYTITGAPRVIKGKVMIGNGGAEYGVRGYISAYDADTGERAWRFYTVPGNPWDGYESDAMAMAAETWSGEWWQYGGGGTVWDSMAYDPALDLLYIGVGNGSVWNRELRSPEGGDNLFLSSIVALDPDTGDYVWHYQTTPGDSWDYTATQHMILADLEIAGETRQVIMQAPKNGFFYVLDRSNGELITAENYVDVSWASGIDPDTGRPVETDNARYQADNPLAALPPEQQVATLKSLSDDELANAFHRPGPLGAHNWHPMSYSPATGLVYIPALEIPFAFGNEPAFEYIDGRWNTAVDPLLNMPTGDQPLDDRIDGLLRGHLSAWDPVQQQEVWRVQHAGSWNGGVLATAGNLVFQGTSHGQLVAYSADKGEELWSAPTQTGVVAAPVSYRVDGEQYVAVVAGWGGAFPLVAGGAAEKIDQQHRGRLLVYQLGGEQQLPPLEPDAPLPPVPPVTADAAAIQQGKVIYHTYCGVCHGPGVKGGGVISDLRHMGEEKHQVFNDIVLEGIYQEMGMVSFADVMTEADAAKVQAYILQEAHQLRDE